MQRPEIICHMVTSLDGRLLPDRWPFSEDHIMSMYEATAAKLDASGWAVGRATMLHYVDEGEPDLLDAPRSRQPIVARSDAEKIGICFDRLGRLRPESGDIDGDHLVIVVSDKVSQRHIDRLVQSGVSVFFSGPDGEDIETALCDIAASFDVKRLLLEGGGEMNGAFLSKDLIDETSILILPVLDGGQDVPAIVAQPDGHKARKTGLISSETLADGTVWLRHRLIKEI